MRQRRLRGEEHRQQIDLEDPPGFVLDDPDLFGEAGRKRVFIHDASTLGGNSGSGILEFRIDGRAIVGLHFGGKKREENYAHATARLEDILSQRGATFVD